LNVSGKEGRQAGREGLCSRCGKTVFWSRGLPVSCKNLCKLPRKITSFHFPLIPKLNSTQNRYFNRVIKKNPATAHSGKRFGLSRSRRCAGFQKKRKIQRLFFLIVN
jgi:hypothetical protein